MGRRRSPRAIAIRSVATVLLALCSAATLAGAKSAADTAAAGGRGDGAPPLWPEYVADSGSRDTHDSSNLQQQQQQPWRRQRAGPAQEGHVAERAFVGNDGMGPGYDSVFGVAEEEVEATTGMTTKRNTPSHDRASSSGVTYEEEFLYGRTVAGEEETAAVEAAQDEGRTAPAADIAAGVLAALAAAVAAALGSAESEAAESSLFSSASEGGVFGGEPEHELESSLWSRDMAAADSPGHREHPRLQQRADKAVRAAKEGGGLRGAAGHAAGAPGGNGAVVRGGEVSGVNEDAGTDIDALGAHRILQVSGLRCGGIVLWDSWKSTAGRCRLSGGGGG